MSADETGLVEKSLFPDGPVLLSVRCAAATIEVWN